MMPKMDVGATVSDGAHPTNIVFLGNYGREVSSLPMVRAWALGAGRV